MTDDKLIPTDPTVIEKLIIKGDLSGLSPEQKVSYYHKVCQVVGLNPATQPLAFIDVKGPGGTKRQILYALRNATDQLCKIHKISTEILKRETLGDTYCVVCKATKVDGQTTDALGAVPLGKLTGDFRANAMMKAETKAKRRAVLSLVGLSLLDETEVETIKGASFPPPLNGLPRSTEDDIDDTQICHQGQANAEAPVEEPSPGSQAGPSAENKPPAEEGKNDRKAWWRSEFKDREYIHIYTKKGYDAEWLESLGFKPSKKKKGLFSIVYEVGVEDALVTRQMELAGVTITTEEIEALRQGFRNMGMDDVDEVKQIIQDQTGKPPDPEAWTREDYNKLREFQGDNYPT